MHTTPPARTIRRALTRCCCTVRRMQHRQQAGTRSVALFVYYGLWFFVFHHNRKDNIATLSRPAWQKGVLLIVRLTTCNWLTTSLAKLSLITLGQAKRRPAVAGTHYLKIPQHRSGLKYPLCALNNRSQLPQSPQLNRIHGAPVDTPNAWGLSKARPRSPLSKFVLCRRRRKLKAERPASSLSLR